MGLPLCSCLILLIIHMLQTKLDSTQSNYNYYLMCNIATRTFAKNWDWKSYEKKAEKKQVAFTWISLHEMMGVLINRVMQ